MSQVAFKSKPSERYASASTCRVDNWPEVLAWMGENLSNKAGLILADNRKIFPDLFGPYDQKWTSIYQYHIWTFTFNGLEFWVIASKRGTSVEISDEAPWDELGKDLGPLIVEFMEWLANEIDNLPPFMVE